MARQGYKSILEHAQSISKQGIYTQYVEEPVSAKIYNVLLLADRKWSHQYTALGIFNSMSTNKLFHFQQSYNPSTPKQTPLIITVINIIYVP